MPRGACRKGHATDHRNSANRGHGLNGDSSGAEWSRGRFQELQELQNGSADFRLVEEAVKGQVKSRGTGVQCSAFGAFAAPRQRTVPLD